MLSGLTGEREKYYRPAVGIRNPAVHRAALRQGLTVVTWTQAARDGALGLTARRAQAMAARAGPGHILALHDGSPHERSALRERTIEHLPLLLTGLRARGLETVTLRELLAG